MDADTTSSAAGRMVNLRQAAKLANVSEVTLRKHLKLGRVKGTRIDGKYGQTWSIDYDALAEFVQARYGRRLSLRHVGTETAQPQGVDTVRQLRTQLDETLVALGRYKQIAESSETTAAEVERRLKVRIAKLTQDRDAAQRELERLRARGFWRRVRGK